ncbi:MAG: AraC family transcriptional regulator [Lachnospiraceae bacterium]|nr:AraC family transcriptional regulator [Lachnospiraceae bacterium]
MALSDCCTTTDDREMELTPHGTTDFPIACYHDDLSAAKVPWHWHDELELLLVSEGSIVASCGNRQYTLSEGDGLFINTGILHAMYNLYPIDGKKTHSCRLHSLVFHPRLIGGNPDSIFWQKYIQPILTDCTLSEILLHPTMTWQAAALKQLESAWHACVEEPDGYEFQIRNNLSDLLFLLFQNRQVSQNNTSTATLKNAARIKQMLQYIQAHFSENISITEIADSALISTSECLRCFHNTVGLTPIQYVKQYRLEKAAELLRSTDWKIMNIGFACGFQEMSYFARAFQAQYGTTPSDFRKNN